MVVKAMMHGKSPMLRKGVQAAVFAPGLLHRRVAIGAGGEDEDPLSARGAGHAVKARTIVGPLPIVRRGDAPPGQAAIFAACQRTTVAAVIYAPRAEHGRAIGEQHRGGVALVDLPGARGDDHVAVGLLSVVDQRDELWIVIFHSLSSATSISKHAGQFIYPSALLPHRAT